MAYQHSMQQLFGVDDSTKAAVVGLLKSSPKPSVAEVGDLFRLTPTAQWSGLANLLVAASVSPVTVKSGIDEATRLKAAWIKGGLTLASAAVSAFHGARRNDSVPWGVWWFLMGLTFPIFTPVVALAQGFGRRR
jgi:hypothetical protein